MPDSGAKRVARLPVTIREAGFDAWSEIRSLHATSLRSMTAASLDPVQIAAFMDWILAPDYTDALLGQDLQTAWYENELVATAGWLPADDTGASARITAVFVSPLFSRLGVGTRIVSAAESRARAAGFRSFTARVFPPSLAFFEALGYARSSHGALSVGAENGIPVIYMRKAGEEGAGLARD